MEKRFCQFCGAPLEENAAVCTNCGRLPEQAQPVQQSQRVSLIRQLAKKTSGFGIVSLALGIIAIIFSLISVVRVITCVIAPLALVYGLISLTVKKKNDGVAVVGMAIATVALVLTIIFQATILASVNKGADNKGNNVSSTINSDVNNNLTEENAVKEPPTQPQTQKQITAAELEEEIAKQEVRVTSTKYTVQSEDLKVFYPDQLQAIVTNGSSVDIQEIVIAYVAWDKNNLPVKIVTSNLLDDGGYIRKGNGTVNIVSGGTWGRENGLSLSEDCSNISTFKAIVYEYTDFDGNVWENPLYDKWCEVYEGKPLS